MEKLYLGVDLHKRSCWATVLDPDGQPLLLGPPAVRGPTPQSMYNPLIRLLPHSDQ
jgi:hypothetical protein